ncbi:MAG: hypothetical protein JNL60_18865 [Bacteroidia bacterium]|nr:hypothetical protein [Bacteroidia bacterium]
MKLFNTSFWLKISLFNLLIVALYGTLMRYKIGFEFPYFDQKHLQHGHSHFAFIGWIAHTLFVLIVSVLQHDKPGLNIERYRKLIIANLFSAYGMLISFTIQGYGIFSISFSTLSVFIAYAFAYNIFKDLKGLSHKAYTSWFTAALWFNVISSLGTFALAFMMASHNFNQNIHLASLYFYLHFQYNGFFSFACIGLFFSKLNLSEMEIRKNKTLFWMFFLSCIPAYFLSTLWAKLPMWLYVLVVISAFAQVWAWILFIRSTLGKLRHDVSLFKSGRYLFIIIALALSAKYLLQLGSTIPSISKLAFGFRPIVIAYLHLILLAIISVFLLSFMYYYKLININRLGTAALISFVLGVYMNEIVLGIQGIASFSYTVVPFVNESLFVIALAIFTSLVLLVWSQKQKKTALAADFF